MNRLLKNFVLGATAPLRRILRYEMSMLLKADESSKDQDIGAVLRRKATEEAAEYVSKHMVHADSVASNLELLTLAVQAAKAREGALVLEFGVFSGKTVNHIASLVDSPVYGFDSFEGLPERWRDGYPKGAFRVDAIPRVRRNVVLVKGLFDATLPEFAKTHPGPIALLHIDCDLYSSTKTVFTLLRERIHPGCIIVFDEYFNYPGWRENEFRAFHEFLAETGAQYEYLAYNRFHEQVAVKITHAPAAQTPTFDENVRSDTCDKANA